MKREFWKKDCIGAVAVSRLIAFAARRKTRARKSIERALQTDRAQRVQSGAVFATTRVECTKTFV